jgi:tRNA pseudouridine38-40 synthase
MSSDRNIKLLISYDGTEFSGWQRQDGSRTVQGEIESALKKIHKHEIKLTGSGRTDAGVHAAGQAANFYTPLKNMEASRFVPALNGLLSQDVRILEASQAGSDFHARFDAKARIYRYYFVAGRRAAAREYRYSVQLWRHPRIDTLNSYGRQLLGERDCTVFASPADASRSRRRHINMCRFFIEGDRLVFEISANAFLWKMARSIAGTLLRCEEKGISAEEFRALAASGDRRLAGPALPPQGLFLWKVEYYRV